MRQEALANYAYFFFSRQLEVVEDENLPTINVELYIATWRAYFHSDDETLTFILLKQKYANYEDRVTNLENTGEDLRSEIERDLSNQVSEKLQRFVENGGTYEQFTDTIRAGQTAIKDTYDKLLTFESGNDPKQVQFKAMQKATANTVANKLEAFRLAAADVFDVNERLASPSEYRSKSDAAKIK